MKRVQRDLILLKEVHYYVQGGKKDGGRKRNLIMANIMAREGKKVYIRSECGSKCASEKWLMFIRNLLNSL